MVLRGDLFGVFAVMLCVVAWWGARLVMLPLCCLGVSVVASGRVVPAIGQKSLQARPIFVVRRYWRWFCVALLCSARD
ncbi:uncharacterized protein B0I36DRAFT_336100 [Microdochium trichocladiopsis]|uniref:Uncharacterized protein n=1 Tax=Microdochium trichocladiopsis TaxID=1682393 RepID=A0A9P8XUS7_9PEZI|nr:uncharacterized protein B0I36DRAFT_336100 [Microdochium trichocladiopsis]KAH7018504.1 hypothetical protein B0I36DRAFT_336100 [Microdochium trichocladiopsis]